MIKNVVSNILILVIKTCIIVAVTPDFKEFEQVKHKICFEFEPFCFLFASHIIK